MYHIIPAKHNRKPVTLGVSSLDCVDTYVITAPIMKMVTDISLCNFSLLLVSCTVWGLSPKVWAVALWAMGEPQFGQAGAAEETCLVQSGQFIRAMLIYSGFYCCEFSSEIMMKCGKFL